MPGWTDERIELLKKLWDDGLAASQIAVELGGVTRNGVIGKVHRLGLAGRKVSAPARTYKPRVDRATRRVARPSRPSGVLSRLGQAGFNAASAAATAIAQVIQVADACQQRDDNVVIPFAQRKTLLELGARTCRWPVGDPGSGDFFFCGGETFEEASYCAYHCRVAYQPHTRPLDRRLARLS